MTIEEIQGLITKYGPNACLQDLLDKMVGDSKDLERVLDNPVDGDAIVVDRYTWKFYDGKWSSPSWSGCFAPHAFKKTLAQEKIIYIGKMMPR